MQKMFTLQKICLFKNIVHRVLHKIAEMLLGSFYFLTTQPLQAEIRRLGCAQGHLGWSVLSLCALAAGSDVCGAAVMSLVMGSAATGVQTEPPCKTVQKSVGEMQLNHNTARRKCEQNTYISKEIYIMNPIALHQLSCGGDSAGLYEGQRDIGAIIIP